MPVLDGVETTTILTAKYPQVAVDSYDVRRRRD
jgi:hypothetical protein